MATVQYGIQMYSLRDITEKDLKDALRQVANMGYKYVEFAGIFGNSAEDVKEWMDTYGLLCDSSHIGAAALQDDMLTQTIADHKTLGCEHLIISGMDWSTKEKMESNIALMNKVQPILAENGLVLGYHNHSHEFCQAPYGVVLEEEIISRTSVLLQIDIWWAFNAGIDPVAFCEEHKERIRMVHLKDGIAVTPEHRNFYDWHKYSEGLSVGSGEAPIVEVRDWCLKNDVQMIIESEGLDPTGPEEVKRCIDYLRTLD